MTSRLIDARRDGTSAIRRYVVTATLILGITLVGLLGYRFIEGFPWIDALYMTVITLSTVGFREVAPLSMAGKLFTIALIVTGIGLVLTTHARVPRPCQRGR